MNGIASSAPLDLNDGRITLRVNGDRFELKTGKAATYSVNNSYLVNAIIAVTHLDKETRIYVQMFMFPTHCSSL